MMGAVVLAGNTIEMCRWFAFLQRRPGSRVSQAKSHLSSELATVGIC